MVGTTVGRYEIVSLLRRGGMGEVYAAQDLQLGRRVALKILPKNRTSDPERVARFVREARASSGLNHPSIVAVHDAGSDGDVHFLAMELIDGVPLSEWMRKRRSLESRVELMAQIADGLAKAHDAGIVHRDLKPDNVMVTLDGHAKIVDFGVAKLTERIGERGATGITTPTSRVGTTAYMSPEQIEGKSIDHRADVFAFGAVLYELLVGESAFAAEQYADTIHNVVHRDPPMDRVPPSLRRVVRRCLRKEPRLRYDSLRDAALDLRESIEDVAVATKPRRVSPWLALVLLPLIALAAMWYVNRREPAKEPAPPMIMSRLTNSGKVTTAAISPDGKYLVYSERDGANEALFVKQIATGTVTRIIDPTPTTYYTVQVSPDGAYAYFTSASHREQNVLNLDQIPLLGGAPRRIADDTENWFSLSPDGKRVTFRRYNVIDRYHVLTIAAVDGSGEQTLLRRKQPEFISSPTWTADGEAISFIGGNVAKRNSGGFFLMNLATKAITQVRTPQFAAVGSYAWLADGSGLLVAAYDREQPPQIWYVLSGDTSGKKVTSEVSAYYGVTPTADSRSFSVVRDTTDSNIYTASLGHDAMRPLTSGIGNRIGGGTGGVRWLGDSEVLFHGSADGMNTIFAVDAKGGAPRRLIHNMAAWNIAVSPDGKHVAYLSDKSGTNQVWMVDANGANARQITHDGNVGSPAFTPDGRSLIYMRSDEQQFAWRVPLDGSTPPVAITKVPTNRPTLSPDGKWLLCRLRTNGESGSIWRTALVAMDGVTPTRYFDVPSKGALPMLQWAPDGRGFLFVDYADGVANVWRQELDGRAPRQETFFKSGEIFAFDLGGDGKSLAISRGESTRDAVLIRDFR
ncbi:MAG TPA: protein kinase [Thermoanaerobaculia bacterium]